MWFVLVGVELFLARPRADPIERPYLAWVQKHHIAATDESPESMNISNVRMTQSVGLSRC
jgi:hypothetical protein